MLILFSLYSITAVAKCGFFTTYQINSGKRSSKYTLQVDTANGPRKDAFQMRQLILYHHKKRFGKEKKPKQTMLWMQHPQQMAIKEDSN